MLSSPRPVQFTGASGNRLVGDLYDPYDEGSDRQRPTVLLAHGGGQNRFAWARSAEQFQRGGFRVVTYDHRGHGDSDWVADGYDNPQFAADLAVVREAVEVGHGVVGVGASLGGMAVIGAHEIIPADAWRGVVLVDVTPRLEPSGARRIIGFMAAHPDGFTTLDEAAEVIAVYNSHRPRPASNAGLTKVLRQREDGRWIWRWDPGFVIGRADILDEGVASPERLAAMAERMLGLARRITAPALLVRGGLSDLVSPETAREFLSVVPHAGFVDVTDAGHMVAGDDNDAFAGAVLDFLRSLD